MRLVFVTVGDDGQHRAEDLFAGDPHVVARVAEQCRPHIPAACRDRRAGRHHRSPGARLRSGPRRCNPGPASADAARPAGRSGWRDRSDRRPSSTPFRPPTRRRTRPCVPAGTRIRLSALHTWPLLARLANWMPAATAAGSASSSTMAADLPPSSRLTCFSPAAHASATWRPAAVDPVNETLSTPGWPTRSSPTSRSPGTTFNTPGGRSAAATRSASSCASSTDSGAGLSTTEQPASSAGTTLQTVRNCGMFHGTTAATTPTGCLTIRMSLPYRPGRSSCQS